MNDPYIKIFLEDVDENFDTLVRMLSTFTNVNSDDVVFSITETNEKVYHIPLTEHLDREQSDLCVNYLQELSNDIEMPDFDMEFSTGIPLSPLVENIILYSPEIELSNNTMINEGSMTNEPQEEKPESYDLFKKTDYDLLNDLIVFIRNDFRFYRKYYYPAMHKIAKEYNNTNKADFKKHLRKVIDTAIKEYCSIYNTPEEPDELFSSEDKQEIINMISKDELPEIRNGEYL